MIKISKYTIRSPIWDGGTKQRAIGIAEFRLPCLVNIDYKDEHGNIVYPHEYMVTKEFANQFRVQTLSNEIRLRIIPISQLEKCLE